MSFQNWKKETHFMTDVTKVGIIFVLGIYSQSIKIVFGPLDSWTIIPPSNRIILYYIEDCRISRTYSRLYSAM